MSNLLDLMNEDSPLQPTADSSKQSLWFLASVMIGCTICVPIFVMGASMAHTLPFHDFVPAVLLGGLLVAAIAAATGVVGQRTGLPTAMLAKIAFGSRGYILANAAMAVNAIGWFGIQTTVFSNAFVELVHQLSGISLPVMPVMVMAGLIMSSTAIIGFRGLGKLSYIAVPLLLVMLMLPLWIAYTNGSLATVADKVVTGTTSFGLIIGAYSFAATMPDVTRFMRTGKATVAGIGANFILAYPLLLILTGTVALAAGQSDYIQIMMGLGYGVLAVAVLFLATWTTNDTNVYAGSLSVNLFLPQFHRWQIATGVGVVGTIFSVLGIFDHFMSWLILSGNLFSPMAGVYVADYWLNRKRYAGTAEIPAFRLPQLCAWLIGLAVGQMTTGTDNMGFGVLTLTGVPMIDAMLAAALVQLVLHYTWDKED